MRRFRLCEDVHARQSPSATSSLLSSGVPGSWFRCPSVSYNDDAAGAAHRREKKDLRDLAALLRGEVCNMHRGAVPLTSRRPSRGGSPAVAMARVKHARPYDTNHSVYERALPSSARFFVALAGSLQVQVSRVLCHAMSQRPDAGTPLACDLRAVSRKRCLEVFETLAMSRKRIFKHILVCNRFQCVYFGLHSW